MKYFMIVVDNVCCFYGFKFYFYGIYDYKNLDFFFIKFLVRNLVKFEGI